MKSGLRVSILSMLWTLAALALPALADSGDGGRLGRRHRFDGDGAAPMRQGLDPAERAGRLQELRRGEAPGYWRMSPEERRQLRRDIRSAGDDIYRRPPPFEPPPHP